MAKVRLIWIIFIRIRYSSAGNIYCQYVRDEDVISLIQERKKFGSMISLLFEPGGQTFLVQSSSSYKGLSGIIFLQLQMCCSQPIAVGLQSTTICTFIFLSNTSREFCKAITVRWCTLNFCWSYKLQWTSWLTWDEKILTSSSIWGRLIHSGAACLHQQQYDYKIFKFAIRFANTYFSWKISVLVFPCQN